LLLLRTNALAEEATMPRANDRTQAYSRWLWGALVFVCIGFAGWSGALAVTVPASSGGLNGDWTNTATDQGRAAIERGVDQAIADMFGLARPTARSRLKASNPPIAKLALSIAPGRIRIDLGHGRDTEAAPSSWQPAKSATGDKIRVRYSVLSERLLKMESTSDGGTGRHTFQLSDNGNQLKHEVRIESSHLPKDVRYVLTYRRAP
jgi:hypothetical protein